MTIYEYYLHYSSHILVTALWSGELDAVRLQSNLTAPIAATLLFVLLFSKAVASRYNEILVGPKSIVITRPSSSNKRIILQPFVLVCNVFMFYTLEWRIAPARFLAIDFAIC